jgi:PAS domain S-box-containing protein
MHEEAVVSKVTAGPNRQTDTTSQSSDDYRAIFQATGDGVIIADMDGNLVDVNPALCRMHGYSREDMLRLFPTQFIHPAYHGVFAECMASLNEERPYRTTALDVREDGTAFPVEVNGTVFTYRGRRHVLAIVRDITVQVHVQEMLEQRVEERTRELATLLEVAHNVASTLELQSLLRLILDQLKVVSEFDGASILELKDGRFWTIQRQAPGDTEEVRRHQTDVLRLGSIWEALSAGRPVIIDDVWQENVQAREFREANGRLMETVMRYVRSWLAVPLIHQGRLNGLLTLASTKAGFFTTHHAALALAIAQQAAVAIENARLYEKAQELAALEERQRLARELHDSVTQALYGIGLAAETTRLQLDRDPDRAASSNEIIRSLARAGMAEMRALLFELRPESLELEGLVAALQKQADALAGRHEIPIETTLCEEPPASMPVKEALYRIAQEALHNAIKHAHPTTLALRLDCVDGEILLEVEDDGEGFDTSGSFPGHLGMHSMRERAAKVGGVLEVKSAPHKGTHVRALLPSTGGL